MKTLVLYATTYGFTKECVEDLSKELNGEVIVVDVMKEEVPTLESFDQVVIGGSVYIGQLQKKLKLVCTEQLSNLMNKRLALFLCCGLPENFEQVLSNSIPEQLINHAFIKECFGGELRMENMKFSHKLITNLMKKATAKEGKPEPKKLTKNIQKFASALNQS